MNQPTDISAVDRHRHTSVFQFVASLTPHIVMTLAVLFVVVASPASWAQNAVHHSPVPAVATAAADSAMAALPDSIPVGNYTDRHAVEVIEDEFSTGSNGNLIFSPVDTLGVLTAGEALEANDANNRARSASVMKRLSRVPEEEWIPTEKEFNPDPTRAVWLSALFPGLGQIYNRRYWKLPIVVGGYLGLGYATSWNNQMLKDYTRAYADLIDNDPSSNSYMDFFAPNVNESDLDKEWLKNVLRSKKNFFRRNRDLCIISMVGVYLLAMVDAYVDASLAHFDIAPHLSMDVGPAVMQDGRTRYPSLGLAWALNF